MTVHDTTAPGFLSGDLASRLAAQRDEAEIKSRRLQRDARRAEVQRFAPRIRTARVVRVTSGSASGPVATDGRPLVTVDFDSTEVEAEWLTLPELGDRVCLLIEPGGLPLILGVPKGTPGP